MIKLLQIITVFSELVILLSSDMLSIGNRSSLGMDE